MAQKTPQERRLTIIRLLDTQWLVYDLDDNSFLCSTVEFPVYQPGVDRLYVNIPIPFTTHAYAQEIIDGKQTIGGLQQILNNLRVGFQKEIGHPTSREKAHEVIKEGQGNLYGVLRGDHCEPSESPDTSGLSLFPGFV